MAGCAQDAAADDGNRRVQQPVSPSRQPAVQTAPARPSGFA